MNSSIPQTIIKSYKLENDINKMINLTNAYSIVNMIQSNAYFCQINGNNSLENIEILKNTAKFYGYNLDNFKDYSQIINYLELIKKDYKKQASDIVKENIISPQIENLFKNILNIR